MITNEYNKLKKCIVGREFYISEKMFDLTFKIFFQSNLEDLDYCDSFKNDYTAKILEERNEDLDNLASVLRKYNVEVLRPKKIDKIIDIKTPTFKSICGSSSNVRDLTFIYKDTIFETPPSLTGRYFENYWLNDIFNDLYSSGYNWIQVPKAFLTKIDCEQWRTPRNYAISKKYDMFFDAANLLKFDNFVLYNYSSYNHYKGIQWLKRNLDVEVVPVRMTDNHIDGCISSIGEGVLLVNDKNCIQKVDEIKKLKDYKILRLPNKIIVEDDISDSDLPNLASKDGMSINVLNIDPKTILVNKDDIFICDLLDKNGFNVIPVQLRYCRAFGGGIHCSTLDVDRE